MHDSCVCECLLRRACGHNLSFRILTLQGQPYLFEYDLITIRSFQNTS